MIIILFKDSCSLKGRLYNSVTSLVLVLTILSRLITSVTCWQLPAISKNSAISGSWNISVMNQTFYFILLLFFFPIRALLPSPSSFHTLRKQMSPGFPAQLCVSWWRLSCSPHAPAQPPSGSIPSCGKIPGTFNRTQELMQKPWNATLKLYFKVALNCKQSAIDFKHWFFCCCFPYFNTWTVQLYLHLCKEHKKKDQQLSITSISLHRFCVNMVWPLAYTDPKLPPSLFNLYLTAELKKC